MLPPRVTAARGPLRRALVLLVAATLSAALVEAVLGARAAPQFAAGVAAFPVVGFLFVAVGALAWSRRPANRTGFLLAVCGLTVLLAATGNVDDPVLIALGVLAGQTPIVAALHLTLAFPAGQVRDAVDRFAIAAAYVLVVLAAAPMAFPGWPNPPVPATVMLWLRVTLVTVVGLRAIARAVRTTGAGSSERHVMVAVTVFGGAFQLFLVVTARVIAPLFELDAYELFVVQLSVFVLAPFVYATGVLRGGFGRTGELAELAAWLGSSAARSETLRDALARVLGDPSLEVLFTRPGSGTLIDAEGRPAAPPASVRRGAVPVPGADGMTPAATLSYDRSLIPDPGVVEQAGAVVSLALERERLDAELLAERAALRASRARVVEVADDRRRELAQDLHDILQNRLTLAALHAGQLAATSDEPGTRDGAARLRDELDRLITEFRAVVHGVMPALLVERGLAAAAEDLVDRQPVPTTLRLAGAEQLPLPLATTAYFVLAEALTNAVRHACASSLEVAVVQAADELRLEVVDDGVGGATARASGRGLRGIADRVDAHGGSLHLDSPAGGGTRVRVVLPCVS